MLNLKVFDAEEYNRMHGEKKQIRFRKIKDRIKERKEQNRG